MFDFKCAVQVQLDNLWLKPEDMARGLDVRVSSVRNWLDPDAENMPPKEAFDWLYDQSEMLGDLTMERLNQVYEAHAKFGQYILRWYRLEDMNEDEPVGLQNLATKLVVDQLKDKGIECSIVFACRDDEWIEQNLDCIPEIDPKAAFASKMESLGVPPFEIALALGITPRSVKDWKKPSHTKVMPIDDAWDFLDEYAVALDGRTEQLLEQRPNPMPYHPLMRLGKLTQQDRIDNKAALLASKKIMDEENTIVDFAYI